MTNETLQNIHKLYQESVENSADIMSILTNLYSSLSILEVPEEDSEQFDLFLEGLKGCIKTRYKTFDLTNLSTDIIFVMMYIIIWLNNTQHMHIDINLNARRKSLESDLVKMLYRATSTNESVLITDRFGLRGIILNNESTEQSTELLLTVSKYFIGIITNTNRKARMDFLIWVKDNSNIDSFTKERINDILKLPVVVDLFFDYVNNPKPNGYQSLHYILAIDMYSDRLPGAKLELQLRTNFMHQTAVTGSASHDNYKDSIPEEIKNTFKIDDFSKVQTIGFSGYSSHDEDMDGIHFSKPFYIRRISSTLVR